MLLLALGCGWKRDTPLVYAPDTIPEQCGVLPESRRTILVNRDGKAGTCGECLAVDTISDALSKAEPGDHIVIDGGTWEDEGIIEASVSGTVDAPIIITGSPNTVVLDTLQFTDTSNLQLWGFTMHAEDGAWATFTEDSHNIAVVGMGFDELNKRNKAFGGLMFEGSDIEVCGSAFGLWVGDAVVAWQTDRFQFRFNDLSAALMDHAAVTWNGQDAWIRGNLFHNPWDRVLAIAEATDGGAVGAVIEDNVFVDSNWDRDLDRYRGGLFSGDRKDGGGAFEVARVLGDRHIVRNNAFIASNIGVDEDCVGVFTLTAYTDGPYDTRAYHQLRFYDNAFVGNALSAIGVIDGEVAANRTSYNRFLRNVFVGNDTAAFSFCGDDADVDSWIIEDNLFDETSRIQQPQDSFDNASTLEGNTTMTVSLRDPSRWKDGWDAKDTEDLLLSVVLEDQGGAPPLATLVGGADASDVLVVSDALVFWDGGGMITGDRITVGGVQTTVLERIDEVTLVVDPPVTAPAESAVDLESSTHAAGIQPSRLGF